MWRSNLFLSVVGKFPHPTMIGTGAYPPSEDFPFGNCDMVLIETMRDDGQTSMQSCRTDLPTYLSTPLLYVQYFHFIISPDKQPELSMWTVECSQGAVVQITDVTHAIELIPCFGEKVASDISSATCLERHEHFFLNNFADKESYHTFSLSFINQMLHLHQSHECATEVHSEVLGGNTTRVGDMISSWVGLDRALAQGGMQGDGSAGRAGQLLTDSIMPDDSLASFTLRS
ncbi:hypothetical protein EV424DRAFT_1342483 [Suillus variegatus]|nr:hypothetical protein EV424DRAFT_1342483 [Suillus variegatus]